MKISFKVADYSADRLVIVSTDQGGRKQLQEDKKVVIRLFNEATVDRLVEVGNCHTKAKETRFGKWRK